MNGDNSEREVTSRVNSKRLSEFVGKTVRLPCKVLKVESSSVIVQASDEGQVIATIPIDASTGEPCDLTQFVEIVGKVTGPANIKSMACICMGEELDMKLVNDTIELIHDNRFYHKLFS